MHLLKKSPGLLETLGVLICMEDKLKVMAMPALPAILILSTQRMEGTDCSFWVKGQLVSGTQPGAFHFPYKTWTACKQNGQKHATFTLGCHDSPPSTLSRSAEVGVHLSSMENTGAWFQKEISPNSLWWQHGNAFLELHSRVRSSALYRMC